VLLLSLASSNGEGSIAGLAALLGWLLTIGIVLSIAWLAWYLWRRLRTPTAKELSRRFQAVRSMSGAEFEVFVADLFGALGHKAVVLGGAGDQGVDVIVNRGSERIAVQCKNHRKAVGNKPVQEVYAGARHHRCAEACVVAPAGYTKGASELARSTGVSLYDADSIRRWIRKVDKLEKGQASETNPATSHPSPKNASVNEAIRGARKRAVWYPHPDDPPKD
jgi:restriction system protein